MEKTTVFVIRHGENHIPVNSGGVQVIYGADSPLTEEGRETAKNLAIALSKRPQSPYRLYSSPYLRAIQTAEIITKSIGITEEIIRAEGLRDIWAPGWLGQALSELQQIGGNYEAVPPRSKDQEKTIDMANRIMNAFHQILDNEQGKIIGIISHGDPIRLLIGRLINPDGLPVVRRDEMYLPKGYAWELVFNEDSKLTGRMQIAPLGSQRTLH